MKYSILSLLILAMNLLIAQPSFAVQIKPPTCPTLDSIKNVGVSVAVFEEGRNAWFAIEWRNNFHTNKEWSFIIDTVEAKNTSEALSKANDMITNLARVSEPEFVYGTWICSYFTGENEIEEGVAMTPPLNPLGENLSLKRLRHG